MSHVMNTYARQPVAFARGQGVWLWDEAGKKYLDALAGIAVNTLGHNHPRLVRALAPVRGEEAADGAAEALAYAWEHWDRVAGMVNPAAYLFVVVGNQHRRRFRNRFTKPVFDVGPAHRQPWCEPGLAKSKQSRRSSALASR